MKKSSSPLLVHDHDLMAQYQSGNSDQALSQIYRENVDVVYKYIFKHCGNRGIAEDITSDTFMTFIEKIEKYSGNSRIRTFLIGIAVNKLRQHWQKNPNNDSLDRENFILPTDHTRAPEKVTDQKTPSVHEQLEPHMKRVLQELPEKYRMVLHYRFQEHLTSQQVAKKMNTTSGNVRVIQTRALEKARTIARGMIKKGTIQLPQAHKISKEKESPQKNKTSKHTSSPSNSNNSSSSKRIDAIHTGT